MAMTQAATGYFDRVAGDWDEIRAGYFTEAVRESAIAHAYLRPEMEVADVGCGTGFVAAGLAPLVSRVYALDGSPAMLDVARRNLAAYDNVVYQTTEGSALTLPDASVDAALANMYLHHCTDPAAAIREMARIVRPGGRLVITDMDRHEHEWMRPNTCACTWRRSRRCRCGRRMARLRAGAGETMAARCRAGQRAGGLQQPIVLRGL